MMWESNTRRARRKIRLAWSWSAVRSRRTPNTSDPVPSSKRFSALQDPCKRNAQKCWFLTRVLSRFAKFDQICCCKSWNWEKAHRFVFSWKIKTDLFTHLLWLTSTRDPIFDVVKDMCSSPMTISNSWKNTAKILRLIAHKVSRQKCRTPPQPQRQWTHSHQQWLLSAGGGGEAWKIATPKGLGPGFNKAPKWFLNTVWPFTKMSWTREQDTDIHIL